MLKPVFGPILARPLSRRFDKAERRAILDAAYDDYDAHAADVPDEATAGARVLLHLSAVLIGLYRALVARGVADAEARDLIAEVTERVFLRIVGVSNIFGALGRGSKAEQFKRSSEALGRVLFAPPSWQMEEVADPRYTVAFDMHRCPLAEYFAARDASDLCVSAICALDFKIHPESEVKLIRIGTIAGGADRCDFRWRVRGDDDR